MHILSSGRYCMCVRGQGSLCKLFFSSWSPLIEINPRTLHALVLINQWQVTFMLSSPFARRRDLSAVLTIIPFLSVFVQINTISIFYKHSFFLFQITKWTDWSPPLSLSLQTWTSGMSVSTVSLGRIDLDQYRFLLFLYYIQFALISSEQSICALRRILGPRWSVVTFLVLAVYFVIYN